MEEKTITLRLSVNETNQILGVLGRLPYAEVFGLIAKIQSQATGQIKTETKKPE